MALHDIEGEVRSVDRNHSPLNAGSTWINPVVDGNENNLPQILIGRQTDGFGTGYDVGMKVAKQGNDVRTAANDELIFSTAFNNFKIVATGTQRCTALAATPGYQIFTGPAHGQGDKCSYLAFASITSDTTVSQSVPFTSINYASGIIEYIADVLVNSTTLDFEIMIPTASSLYGSAPSFVFRYYILVETAATV